MKSACAAVCSGGMNMKHTGKITAVLLALSLTVCITACGKTGVSSSDTGESAAESAAETSSAAIDKAARPTADGIYISKEGLLKVPEEITLKETKTAVSKTLVDGDYRIQAVTGEIGGRTYTIREAGAVPASYVQVVNEHENAYLFGVSGHAVAAELLEDGSANYVVNISSDQCILLTLTPNGITEKDAKRMIEKEFDQTAELYDTLITDFINASEIAWA